VKGIAEDSIDWERDPDFGYLVATGVPGIADADSAVLRPRELYESQGRRSEYEGLAARFKGERSEFLSAFPSLSDDIVAAVR
jgi:phosphoenolpyruvate carboxykinase (ATP)